MGKYLIEETVQTDKGTVLLVTLVNRRLDSLESVEACKQELRVLDPAAKIVVDLGNTPVLRSVIISGLLGLNKATRLSGGHLCLCNIASGVQDVLRVLKLDKLLMIRASKKDAVWAVSDYSTN